MIIHYYKEQIIPAYNRLVVAKTDKDKKEECARIEEDAKCQKSYIDKKNILVWCLEPTERFPYR